MYDGFSVDLSSNAVPDIELRERSFRSSLSPLGRRVPASLFDTRGGGFNPGALAESAVSVRQLPDFQSEASSIGQRVPTRYFDTRGGGFNPGALAQLVVPSPRPPIPEHQRQEIIRPFAPIPGRTNGETAPGNGEPEPGNGLPPDDEPLPGNGNGNGKGTFFRNPDGTLRTGRVAISMIGGGVAAGLLIRALL